jgi:Mn-dependent DtxR family transcriptional regulator
MKERIGTSAGTIWRILQKEGEVAISKLPTMLNESDSMAYQALGWLAREGKLDYRTEGRDSFVSLAKTTVVE